MLNLTDSDVFKLQDSTGVLSKKIQDGDANKDYIALCEGTLGEKSGTLVHYLRKDSETKLAKVVSEEEYNELYKEQTVTKSKLSKEQDATSHKKAILSYEVEKEFGDSSIIKVHLQTATAILSRRHTFRRMAT